MRGVKACRGRSRGPFTGRLSISFKAWASTSGRTGPSLPTEPAREVFGGIEHLYCHPMDLSGWVKVDAVPAIEEALKNGSTFTPRSTDIVRQAMNYTPEEYRKVLEPKREELEAKLIDLLTTTRKNKYTRPDGAIKLVPTIERPYRRGSNELAAVAGAFQAEVIRSLVETGRLIQTSVNGMDYYRAPKCGRRIGKVAP